MFGGTDDFDDALGSLDVDALVSSSQRSRPASEPQQLQQQAGAGPTYAAGAGVLADDEDADLDALLSQQLPDQATQEYHPWPGPRAAATHVGAPLQSPAGRPARADAEGAGPVSQPAYSPYGRPPRQQQRQLASAWDYPVQARQEAAPEQAAVDLSQDEEVWDAPAAVHSAPPQRLRRITKRAAPAVQPMVELD